jgi:ubiquinone/menaquinone biosynthesis C-methylase UbiE
MDTKESVQHQFGRSAQDYVESALHKSGKDLDILVKMAELTGKEKVLDVATGGGHTANAFAPFSKEVVALDLTPEMLEAAERFVASNGHTNVTFIQGDAEKMPFGEDSFDVVTCRIAPHHFPDIQAFVSEAARLLKPGGLFLLDDNVAPELDEWDFFYNKVEKWRDPSHYRAHKKTEWLKLIEGNGFEIEQTVGLHKTFLFDSWFDRMKLPEEEKEKLSKFMLKASPDIHHKFRFKIQDQKLQSFVGEAFIIKARKYDHQIK